MTQIFLLLGLLVVVAGLAVRLRIRDTIGKDRPLLDDEALRRIQEEGVLYVEEEDEPLDPEEIGREEERFWDQTWD